MSVCPVKTQVSLGIHPVWSESLLCAQGVAKNPSFFHADSEDSDQPGHLPSLIRIFTVRVKKPWVISYPFSAQRRLWSDWADAQADLSLRWAHSHFVGFVMSRLKSFHNLWHKKKQHHSNQTQFVVVVVVCSGLTSLLTIFQSDHDGVWWWQGVQCSFL